MPGRTGSEPRRSGAGGVSCETKWNGPPLRVEIEKRIPIAAGLAGGSADAAAVLRLAAEAAGVDDLRWLEDIAAGLGADVPSQVRGGLVLATGIGARLRPLADRLQYSVIVIPVASELRAGDVYAEADRLGLCRETLDLARALTRTQAALSSETILFRVQNDLQEAAVSLCPAIEEALEAALAAGADHALVSGSGPTVLGLFIEEEHRERAAAAHAALIAAGRSPDADADAARRPDVLKVGAADRAAAARRLIARRETVDRLGDTAQSTAMTSQEITYLVASVCAIGALSAFVALIAFPAWSAYSKTWERVAASFLSLFVLIALIMVGALGGVAIAYYWDSIAA